MHKSDLGFEIHQEPSAAELTDNHEMKQNQNRKQEEIELLP
jgi:hypothetical protein